MGQMNPWCHSIHLSEGDTPRVNVAQFSVNQGLLNIIVIEFKARQDHQIITLKFRKTVRPHVLQAELDLRFCSNLVQQTGNSGAASFTFLDKNIY